jgi:hypothetical protein
MNFAPDFVTAGRNRVLGTSDEKEIDSVLGEIRYLLDRWRIAVSVSGFLWVEPTGKTVSPEELAGLLEVLFRGCDSEYPKVIKLDFSGSRVVGEQWTVVESLLTDFAAKVGGHLRFITSLGRPAAAALITRSTTAQPDTPMASSG